MKKIKKIVSEMEKVLIAQDDPPGVGLAANQVGLDISIFIIRPTEKSKTKVFINPKIIKSSQTLIERERKDPTKRVKKGETRRLSLNPPNLGSGQTLRSGFSQLSRSVREKNLEMVYWL